MGEALLEREQFAFRGAEVAFREHRHDAAALQALVDVMEKDRVGMELAVDRDEAGYALDHRPLEAPGREDGRITQEVDAGLRRKFGQDGKRVEPAQMVGNQDVVAVSGDVVASIDVDAEYGVQKRAGRELDEAEHRRRLALNRKEICWRWSLRLHLPM